MKVLIVRTGALGDVLHALPAVAALRLTEPKWRIDWAVDPRWSPLLLGSDERGPAVSALHLVPTRDWSKHPFSRSTLRSVLGLRKALREEHFDLAVDMQGTLRSAVIARLSGAPIVAGYADPRESLAAHLYTRKIPRRGTHVIDQGIDLLGRACGLRLSPTPVTLPLTAWAEQWAEETVLHRPQCVLAAGAGWAAKQWSPENFGALAQSLHALGFDVLVNASRKDDPIAARVVQASAGTARTVVCHVAGLIALLRRTDLFIGGDSGPTHMAAALAVPLVALFGPTDPARNGPVGPGRSIVLRDPASHTSYKHHDQPDPGLTRLSVATVLEAVHSLL